MASWRRRAGVGAGVASGIAGGLAVQHAVAKRQQSGPERANLAELEAPPGQQDHHIIVSDGGTVHAVEVDGSDGKGAAPAVLLLHGITLSAAVWNFQLRDLSAGGLRVVALDFRGHGESVAGSEGLTMDRLATDVEEVMDKLGMERAVVVGHSMGGMAVLRMMARDPLVARGEWRVGGLALVATSANPVLHRGLPAARSLAAAARPLLARSAALTTRLPGPTLPAMDLAFLLARITFGDEPSPGEVSFTGGLTSEVQLRVAAQLMAEILRFDEEAVLASIRVPTTVMVGDRDLQTPVAHARDLGSGIPGARLVVLPGCGHMVMLERRDELDAVVAELVAEVFAGGSGGRRWWRGRR